jgi:transcriptional regulator with XRE-family HTH domain
MAKQLTRNDVALAAGVAPSTVSRALTGSPLLPALFHSPCILLKNMTLPPDTGVNFPLHFLPAAL